MSGLEALANWVQADPSAARSALLAAQELLQRASPAAAAAGVKPLQLFTGIPAADRAIADAAGLSEIAGRWGTTAAVVLEVLGILKHVALALA